MAVVVEMKVVVDDVKVMWSANLLGGNQNNKGQGSGKGNASACVANTSNSDNSDNA